MPPLLEEAVSRLNAEEAALVNNIRIEEGRSHGEKQDNAEQRLLLAQFFTERGAP
jgi:3-phosphoglycerate kinase